MTERQLQDAIIELAQLLGWRVAHFRPAQTSRGWRTAVSGDGAGFPDLVLVRGRRLVFVELKAARGRTSPEQIAWEVALGDAGQQHYVWRPDDWLIGRVEEVLRAA